MNKNPSRGIYIPTTSKVHPIYEKGHPYYENVHPLYEKRTSQLRVKYILTTSKEVRKCKFFILGGLFLLYELYFSKTAEEDILVYPQSFTPLILVLHQCSPLMTAKEYALISQDKKQPISWDMCPFHHWIWTFLFVVSKKSIAIHWLSTLKYFVAAKLWKYGNYIEN